MVLREAIFVTILIVFSVLLMFCAYNLYVFIRKKFPAFVNCWFCNENACVSFETKNSWVCNKCNQYNGFDENGDYNCDISNQYFEFLNPSVYCQYERNKKSSKGNKLCSACNFKQAEKIQLISDFVPNNENHYDYEIERYRNKLEEIYQVCQNCSKAVDEAVANSKALLLEQYLTHLRSNGLNISNIKSSNSNYWFLYKAIILMSLILSLVHFISLYTALNNETSKIYYLLSPYISYAYNIANIHIENVNNELKITLFSENIYNYINSIQTLLSNSPIIDFYNITHNMFFLRSHTLSINIIQVLLCSYLYAFCSLRLGFFQVMLWFLSLSQYLNIVRATVSQNDFMILDIKITLAFASCVFSMGNFFSNKDRTTVNKVLRVIPSDKLSDHKNIMNTQVMEAINKKSSWETEEKMKSNRINSTKSSTEFNTSNNVKLGKYFRCNNNSHSNTPVFKQSFGSDYFRTNVNGNTQNNYNNSLNGPYFTPISSCKELVEDLGLSKLRLTKNKSHSFSSISCNSLFSTRLYKGNNSNLFSGQLYYKAPIIAPSRLEESFVNSEIMSGRYWSQSKKHMANINNTFAGFSRASSQSSGFESQISSSCNTSSSSSTRDGSICSDLDNASVLSEPSYYSNNFAQGVKYFSPSYNSLQQNNSMSSVRLNSETNLFKSAGTNFNYSPEIQSYQKTFPSTTLRNGVVNCDINNIKELKL